MAGSCSGAWEFNDTGPVMDALLSFVDDESFLFFALVCNAWRRVWGDRQKKTRAIHAWVGRGQLDEGFANGLRPSRTVTRALASFGLSNLLLVAAGRGCFIDEAVCADAARQGHLGVVKLLRDKGCALVEKISEAAARGGHIDVLRYLHGEGCPLGVSIASAALMSGGLKATLECFEFCMSNEVVRKDDSWLKSSAGRVLAMIAAVEIKSPEAVKRLTELGCECTPLILGWAVDSGVLPIVEHAYKAFRMTLSVNSKARLLSRAFLAGNVSGLTVLSEKWPDAKESVPIQIFSTYHHDKGAGRALEWLLANGFRFAVGDETFLSTALGMGCLDIVKIGLRENLSWFGGSSQGRAGFVRAANQGFHGELCACHEIYGSASAMFANGQGIDMALGAVAGCQNSVLDWVLGKIHPTDSGMTAFARTAAANGNTYALRLALESGVSVDNQIAWEAVHGCHLGVLKLLSGAVSNFGSLLVQHEALAEAARAGDVLVFNFLHETVFFSEVFGNPGALMEDAIDSGSREIIELVLKACPGYVVDVGLIHDAISCTDVDNTEIVQVLAASVSTGQWTGRNRVCELAKHGGYFALAQWAVGMGCFSE